MPVFQVGPPNPARGGQPGFIDPMEAIKDQEKAERFQNLQGIVNSIAKRDAQKRDQEKRRVEALAEKNLSREFRNLERFGDEKSYNEYVESGKWIPKGLSEEATGFLRKTYSGMAEQGLSFFNAEKNRIARQAVLKNTEALVDRVVTKELEGLAKTDPRLVDVTAIMKGVVSGPEAEVRGKIQEAFENSPITLTPLTEEELQAVIDKTVVNFKEKKETQRRARKDNQIAAKLLVWQEDNPLDYRSAESVKKYRSTAFNDDFSLKKSFAKEILGENYTNEQFESLQDIALKDFNTAQQRSNQSVLDSLDSQRKAEITDVYTRSQSQSDDLRFIDASSSEFGSRYDSFFKSVDENIAKLQKVVDSDPSRAFDAQRTIDSLNIMKATAQRDFLYKSGLFKSAQKRDGIIGLSKLKISALIQDGIKQGKLQPDHSIEDLNNFLNGVFQDLGTITVEAGEFTFDPEWMVNGFPTGEGFRPGDGGDLVDHAMEESQRYLNAAIEDQQERIAINALRGVSEGLVSTYGDEINKMIADGNYSDITSLFKEEFGIVSEGFDLDEPDLLTKKAKSNLFMVYRSRLKEFLREQLNKQEISLNKLPEVLAGVNSSLTQLDPELSGIVFSGKEINAIKRAITTPEFMDKALEDIDSKYRGALRPGGENDLDSLQKRVNDLIEGEQWDENSNQFKALKNRSTAINKSVEELSEIEGNPQLAFSPEWASPSRRRTLAAGFKSEYYPNFHDSIFDETDQAAAERGRLLDRFNEPSGPNAYFDHVKNFITETDKFATETGNEVARNFVTQFLADANSKIYKQLSHLYATSSEIRSTEKRKNAAQSLVARLSAAMPDSKFEKAVDKMTPRDFARMSVDSSRTELVAGFIEAAGLPSEYNKSRFQKNVLSRLSFSDRDIGLILANPEYGDAVLVSMFREVMGGRAPIVAGERISFSAYLSDWKKDQESLKKQFQRPGFFGDRTGKKPDYIEISDTEITSDGRRLYVFKAFFPDGSVEEYNEIDREYGVGVRQAPPETEEDFADEGALAPIGEKVAPEGTGIEFRSTREEVILKEDEVPETAPESPEETTPPVSEPVSGVLSIPELPRFVRTDAVKPLTEDEIEGLVVSLYEGNENNSFRENIQSSVLYAFHPDAFSEGGTMEMAFGSIDMSMVEFVTSYRENSDYYSTSTFQTFGGEGRGDRSKVKSPNGLYEKEDLRKNPLFEDIYRSHEQIVKTITHRVETAADPASQGEMVGGVALGAGGAYVGAKGGAVVGAKLLAPLGPPGVVAGGVAGFGIGGFFGYLLGGGTGESIGRTLGADKAEQTAYINAFNPQSATPSEIRFMIYSLSRIQEARESGELKGNSYEDLSRFERKILTDLSNIAPDTETFLGDLR